MQKDISTNIHIPEDLWRAVKIKAAEEGKSMKELVLEGLRQILSKTRRSSRKSSLQQLLMKHAGRAKTGVTDGSINHDKYIYD